MHVLQVEEVGNNALSQCQSLLAFDSQVNVAVVSQQLCHFCAQRYIGLNQFGSDFLITCLFHVPLNELLQVIVGVDVHAGRNIERVVVNLHAHSIYYGRSDSLHSRRNKCFILILSTGIVDIVRRLHSQVNITHDTFVRVDIQL